MTSTTSARLSSRALMIAMLVLSSLLTACSSVTVEKLKDRADKTLDVISTKTNIGNNPRDPLEGFNRVVFNFNDTLDQAVVKPVAEAYRAVTPTFVQIGIGNFFGNIGDVWTAVNNLLQGKLAAGTNDIMRVVVNTTFGLGGLIDIGSPAGLVKHKEDFGQTLGVWGMGSGPYLVLPVLGPSTLRDAVVTPVDYYADLWSTVHPISTRNVGTVVRLVDKRASILDAGSLIEEAALDKYVFIRDAYLQRRASEINPDKD